jgi:predicted transcriptional regulator
LFGWQYQTDAARELKLSRSSVVRYASGERPIPSEVFKQLSWLIDERLEVLERMQPDVLRAGEDE